MQQIQFNRNITFLALIILSALTSGGWNKGVPLYTEVSSFQGVRIEGSPVYRGVLTSGGWNREVPLYTEVFSFQGVGIEEFHCIQKCPHFRRAGIERFHCIQRCSHFRGLE